MHQRTSPRNAPAAAPVRVRGPAVAVRRPDVGPPDVRRPDERAPGASATKASAASRAGALAYGLFAYTAFLGTITYAMGFVGDVGVPRSIDVAPDAEPVQAVLWNGGLLGLFAVQHSVMARHWFKERWTRIVPAAVERSTFVLVTCAILTTLFATWKGIGGDVWRVEHEVARAALWTLFGAGWALVVLATFLIDHFDLFGVRQVLRHFRAETHREPSFRVRSVYRYVRHPLYLGFMLAFWSAPHMTWGHALFASLATAFMLVAVRFEEADLVRAHGDDYRRYRERVPMVLPVPGRAW